MDGILADGTAIAIPQGYRLVRNKRAQGQRVMFFGPLMSEFGEELFAWRPCVTRGISLAKEKGYHTVVASRVSRHPLYPDADEYWGVAPFGGFSQISGLEPIVQEAFGEVSNAKQSGFLDKGHSYIASRPSSGAEDRARELVDGKRIMCLCARYRTAEGSRNFPYWQNVVDGILKIDPEIDIICTSTKPGSYDLSRVRYLQDMVGTFNLMDVEICLNRKALCCISSNTGSVGVMIYGLTPNVIVLGGTMGLGIGWHGLRDVVAKENGCQPTSIILAEGGNPPSPPLYHYIDIYRDETKGMQYAGQAVERVRECLSKSRDLVPRVNLD